MSVWAIVWLVSWAVILFVGLTVAVIAFWLFCLIIDAFVEWTER